MKIPSRSGRRGFTLIELSVALMMGIVTGTMVLALFNQQLAFLNIYKTQNFLTEEAPIISTYVSRLVGKADRFRLHATVDDALSGQNPVMADAPVAVLNFRQPDGTMRATILSFENRGQGLRLNYYVVPTTGTLGAPQWSVTARPTDVRFAIEQGVLRMTLSGPAGERIIYSGTMQL
jgi:type II secretory pathway pseudopilin PulG